MRVCENCGFPAGNHEKECGICGTALPDPVEEEPSWAHRPREEKHTSGKTKRAVLPWVLCVILFLLLIAVTALLVREKSKNRMKEQLSPMVSNSSVQNYMEESI